MSPCVNVQMGEVHCANSTACFMPQAAGCGCVALWVTFCAQAQLCKHSYVSINGASQWQAPRSGDERPGTCSVYNAPLP